MTQSARFSGVGGNALHVLQVPAQPGPAQAALLIVHGYCEHGGRYLPFAQHLAAAGIDCWLIDLRGHGQSDGPRGHVGQFADYTGDVNLVLAQLPVGLPLFLFGHSLGGLIALTVAQEAQRRLHGLLLSNPYLANAMPISGPKRLLGAVAARLYPTLRAPAGIKGEFLSRDPLALAALRADPLVFATATAGWFAAVTRAQRAALANQQLQPPLWLGLGTADPIASPLASGQYAESLQVPSKTIVRYEGAMHELLQDIVRDQVYRDVLAWLHAQR